MSTSRKQWLARAEAFDEAAEHLGLSWTDDPTEFEQGKTAAASIRKLADKCRKKAQP